MTKRKRAPTTRVFLVVRKRKECARLIEYALGKNRGEQDDVEWGSKECALDHHPWRSSWQCVRRTSPTRCDRIVAACLRHAQTGVQAPTGACN
jgi:hypothetical protein